jgi:hypothetical protein
MHIKNRLKIEVVNMFCEYSLNRGGGLLGIVYPGYLFKKAEKIVPLQQRILVCAINTFIRLAKEFRKNKSQL